MSRSSWRVLMRRRNKLTPILSGAPGWVHARSASMLLGLLASLAVPFASSCGGPNLRGALAVDRGTEPRDGELSSYSVRSCSDATGAPASGAGPRVSHQRSQKRDILVEFRPRYSSVVIVNTYAEANEQVFAYVSDDAQRAAILHEYRIPQPDNASGGRLLLFDRYTLAKDGDTFRRTMGSPIATCTLVPIATDLR
ncbi:MAG TPA: hypothetical protein VFQ61_24280 [Polyangiaceae bacterium]|nr:hypothetical protein [Polyangiaceae bacterium]